MVLTFLGHKVFYWNVKAPVPSLRVELFAHRKKTTPTCYMKQQHLLPDVNQVNKQQQTTSLQQQANLVSLRGVSVRYGHPIAGRFR